VPLRENGSGNGRFLARLVAILAHPGKLTAKNATLSEGNRVSPECCVEFNTLFDLFQASSVIRKAGRFSVQQ